MLIFFIVISFALLIFSFKICKSILNPCSVYVVIWVFSLLLHESGLIIYNPLHTLTYVVIILFEVLFSLGVFLGFLLIKIKPKERNVSAHNSKLFDRCILATSLIASIAIIPNFIIIINKYGFVEAFNNVSNIYIGRESGEIEYFDYLSPLIYISLILMGINFGHKHFKVFYVLPIILALINSITFGGRNNVVAAGICIIVPFLVCRFITRKRVKTVDHKKHPLRLILCIAALASIIIVFYTINNQRALATSIPPNISPLMKQLVERDYGIYKVVQYFTEPISYLDVYLENPYQMFGANTFNFFYKELNKIGFDFERLPTLPFYAIPMQCNVGSYITELIIDFSYYSVFMCFIFGLSVSIFCKISRANPDSVFSVVCLTILYNCIILSFFMWCMRSTNIWVEIIYSVPVSIIISAAKKRPLYFSCTSQFSYKK